MRAQTTSTHERQAKTSILNPQKLRGFGELDRREGTSKSVSLDVGSSAVVVVVVVVVAE